MSFHSFQDTLKRVQTDYVSLQMGALIWHLCWSAFCLCGLIALLFLPASVLVLTAAVVMTLPGIAATVLLSKDAAWMRRLLLATWAVCGLVAVVLTGGSGGPLAIWLLTPLAAAVALNQRVAITFGAALSFGIALLATLISAWQPVKMPDPQEQFWLATLGVFTSVIGLGSALLPALRARVARTHDAEEAQQKLLRMLTEQPQLVLSLEADGSVRSAYGEAPPGFDLNHMLNHGLAASAYVPERVKVAQAIARAQEEGRAEVEFAPHAAIDHHVHLSLRRGPDDKLYGVMSDTSLLHARLSATEAARAEAETLNQGKSEFLASMSHELRTPLNAVIGFSDIMRQQMFGPMPQKYAEYSQLVWESGQHVLDMINDVLDMSKIEAQRYELTLEHFDMREPVSQALRLMRAAAHDKSVEIKSLMTPQPLMVLADKRAVKQICLNLLSNAVKFTPKGGQITLELTTGETGVGLSVSDTGVGIAPADLSRIGKPYEQSGAPDVRAMGTGLGLSIVKAMAHLHGGDVRIDSRLGQGTVVRVGLPISAAVAEAAPAQVRPDTAAPAVAAVEPAEAEAPTPVKDTLSDIYRTPSEFSSFGDFIIRPSKS